MNAKEKTDKKDIIKGAGVNFIGFLVRLSSRLPYILLVVALFGNALYGRLIFVTTLVELGAALAAFGFKRSLFKFMTDHTYARDHTREEIVTAALFSSFVVGLVMVCGITFLAPPLARWFDYPEMVDSLRYLVPILLIISANEILLAATRVSRNMKYEAMAKSLVEPYVLLITMVIFYGLGFGEMGLFLSYGVSIFASFLTALWGCSRLYSLRNFLKARPNFTVISQMARFSAPTAFHDLALLIFMRMDIFTVKFFFAESILGVYNIAQQITTTVEKIYQSFYPILAPVMAKNLVDKDYAMIERQMVMVSRWTLMIQCLLVVLVVFYGELLMSLIAHKGTDPALLVTAGGVLVLLMIGETINGGFGMTDMPILYRYPLFNPLISVIMVPLYVGLAWVLIRKFDFDVTGVAMALCSTYFIMNLTRIILVQRLMGITMLQMSLLRVILSAGGCSIAFSLLASLLNIDLLSGIGAVVGVPLIFVLYGLSLTVFCLTPDDRARLSGFLKGR